jgi:HK97 family phage portal protein
MGLRDIVKAQKGQKAIEAHPALLNLPISVGGAVALRTPFAQKEAGRHLQAYGGDSDAIDWVMDCVRLITETAADAKTHFEKGGVEYIDADKRAFDTPSEVQDAPRSLVDLFDQPNPYMGYEEFIQLTLTDYLLVGNAYWLKYRMNDAGQPLALYRLAPPLVKVVPGEMGIEGYTYSVPGKEDLKIAPEAVVHFRMPNPHDPYYGLGVIQGGARMLDLELALTNTQASYYENRAQPSMVVQSERRVPVDVFNRLKTQLQQNYSGASNAGELMVLESGLKYQSISPSAADAMFKELTQLSRDRILAMFRVPGKLLGINDDTGSSSDEASESQRIFDDKTMRPLLNKFQNSVTAGVTSAWGLEFKIEYEYLMPIEERLKLAAAFASMPGVKVREVRKYLGLSALGDERDEWVLNLPGEDGTADDTDAGHPDFGIGAEHGRPPNPENTSKFPEVGESTVKSAAVSTRPTSRTAVASGKKALTEEISLDAFNFALEGKALDPNSVNYADRVTVPKDTLEADREAAIDKIAKSLEESILEELRILERGLLDEIQNSSEGKAFGDKLRSRLRNSPAWKTFSSKLTSALEKAGRSAASTASIQQAELGNTPDSDIDYDLLARSIINRKGGVRSIVQNFKNQMAKKVSDALANGGTKDDVNDAVQDAIQVWRGGHAATVALTEATHVYNESVLTVAEESGYGYVYVFDGDEHDEPCELANGQTWTIERARENRLEHPNCRRAFHPVEVS